MCAASIQGSYLGDNPDPPEIVFMRKIVRAVCSQTHFSLPQLHARLILGAVRIARPAQAAGGLLVPSQGVFQRDIPVRRRSAQLRAPGAPRTALISGARRSCGARRRPPHKRPSFLLRARPRPGGAGARRSPGPGASKVAAAGSVPGARLLLRPPPGRVPEGPAGAGGGAAGPAPPQRAAATTPAPSPG